MTLTSGTRLGPYEVTAGIGAGGMGEVYRAKDTKLGRDVAIKVLPGTFAQEPERLARFEREARLLASLNHPGIAHVYGFESATLDDGAKVHFLAMEMVEGRDLAERLKDGPVPVDEVIAIAKQIAEGLEEAHEHGIIHRDLKPANIKVTPDGKVKILDFGLAKAYEGDSSGGAKHPDISHSPTMSRHMTEAGMILGTAAYMSPEQARGKALDRRTDIWAFGVVLYEMLTGARLFAGETVSDVLAAVLTRDPDWTALPAATPAPVRRLLARCLDRDPKKRLRDIGEAGLLLAHPGLADMGVEPATNAASSVRERAAWVTAVLALVVAAGFAVRSNRESAPGTSGPLYFSLSTAISETAPTAIALAPDGTRVAFVGRLPGAAASSLFMRALSEGEARSLSGTEGASDPVFSPDGTWLAYISHNRGLKKIPAEGGTPVNLASGNFRYAQTAWMENGRILLAGFNWEEPGVLYELPDSGGTPTPLPGGKELSTETTTYPRPLPGGRAVLLQTGRDPASLSVQSLDTGERKVLAPNTTFGSFVSGNIVWLENDKVMAAPFDLTRLAFSAPPRAIPTGELTKGGPVAGLAVSKNGSLIFARAARASETAVNPETTRRLVWIDRSGKRTLGPSTDPMFASEPRLSPDETHAIVDGAAGSESLSMFNAPSDVWSVDLRQGTLLRLSFTDGEDETGVWSPDGSWIAWAASRTGQGRGLYRRRSDGSGKEEKLWDSEGRHCHAAAWTPDGRGILMTVDSPKTGFDAVLVTLDPKPSARPLLTDLFNETSVRISPDGRWIAYASDESGRSEIYAQAFPDLGSKIQISLKGGQEPVWRPGGGEIVYRSTASRDFMSVAVEAKGALAVSPPRTLFPDKGLSRGDLDHTVYAVARDGRLLTIQGAPPDARSELGFVLGWAQAAGLVR